MQPPQKPAQTLRTIGTSFFLLFVFLFVFSPRQNNSNGERVDYEEYLTNHPYYLAKKGLGGKSEEGEKKRDRPDLRMQQEFLMTMNPALKRPTPEKLSLAFEQAKGARTQGTLPGENAAPWVERGPNNVGGRTRALMWDPNDDTGKKVWAAGVSGGLWFNNNIASSSSVWTKVDDFWSNLAVSCIAFDPNNPEVFYVGTGEGFAAGGGSAVRGQGIWKSTDGGTSWSQLSASSDFYFVNDIAVRDNNGSSELYVGVVNRGHEGVWAGESEGLYVSSNGGAAFTQVLPNVSGANYPPGVSDIEIAADGSIWVGSHYEGFGTSGGMIYKSDDGISWATVYTSAVADYTGRVELAVAPSAAGVVYALIEGDGVIFEMKRTADAGATWVDMSLPDDDDNGIDEDFTRGQAWYDLIAEVDPAKDSTVIIGGINLHRSTDGGQSWRQISKWSDNPNMGNKPYSYVHADQHAIQFKPGSSSEVIFGNDGGVFWTSNVSAAANNDAISARNTQYNVTQFYATAIHPDKAKSYFLAGAQDNGTQLFQSEGSNSTVDINGGDGGYCFIDQTDGAIQIASYVYNNFALSINNWASSSSIVSDDETGHFINPADYDDENNILYTAATASTLGRFEKGNAGFTRNDLSISLGTKASAIKVSPHTRTSTTLFVGTSAGRIFRIKEANTTTSESTEITGPNFPTGWVSCIEVGQTENHLLVTFSNYGVTSVWYTGNGGATWSAKEGTLPDMPVRWALFNPTNYEEVILATEMGIWGTKSITAASPSWSQFSNGMANVRVDMLQMRDSDYEVIVATHGRGLFSSNIFASQAELTSNFVAKERTVDVGSGVQFIERTKGATSWTWTFEGGTPATATLQNPTVFYASEGTYNVTLVAKTEAGATKTLTIADYISVGSQPTSGCSGLRQVVAVEGTVNDGSAGSDYENNLVCEWLIAPAGATFIDLSFTEFKLELDYDYLYIFKDGEASNANFIAELTGTTIPADISVPSGRVLLRFETDQDITATGWKLNYESDGLAAPSSLSASAISGRTVDLTWADQSSDESGFQVERSLDAVEYITLTPLEAGTTSYQDTGLEPSTNYFYRVKSLRQTTVSVASNVAAVTTLEKGDPDINVVSTDYEFSNNGKEIEVSISLLNDEEEDVEAPFTVEVFLSSDNEYSSDDDLIGSLSVNSLDAGAGSTLAESFDMVILPAGDYFLLAVADKEDAIKEKNETNNTGSTPIELSTVLSVSNQIRQQTRIYPNPATSFVTVETPATMAGKLSLSLSDLSGRILRREPIKSASTKVNLDDLPKGVYLISIEAEDGQYSARIVKQ